MWKQVFRHFCKLGFHLWKIQLFGHDLERYTRVYKRSHSWQCMSEQKPNHEVEGIVCRAPRQDCVEAQIWGRIPKHFCIEGPQDHSGLHHLEPLILFLELSGQPNWAIGGEGPWSGSWPKPQWSIWQGPRVTLWKWENFPEGQPSLQHSTKQGFMVEWPDGSHSSVKGTWQPAWSLPKGT